MKKITQEELNKILNLHIKYLNADKNGKRADLSYANLIGVDLSGADLTYADLSYADLIGANLSGANLRNANLSGAYLSYADLIGANLSGANLRNANLRGANLNDVNLIGAYLIGANLIGANLRNANLRNANLRDADLSGADLSGANLIDVDLRFSDLSYIVLDKKEEIRKGLILKEDLIGYKKCKNQLIVKLLIPKGSVVFGINNSKLRTNRVKVLEITSIDDNKSYDRALSMYNNEFIYEKDQTLEIEDFDLRYNVECGNGIHFFRTKDEAIKHQ